MLTLVELVALENVSYRAGVKCGAEKPGQSFIYRAVRFSLPALPGNTQASQNPAA
jgi:hypothetical protein